jgi:DMSO/TMAO reductase YedYZ molybdopterin-dependent catalytic subunit
MLNRREFLRVAVGGVVLLFQTACQSSVSTPPPRSINNSNASAPSGGATTPPSNLGLPLPLEITPNEKFYVTSFSKGIPGFDGTTWFLEIGGLVERSLKLSLDELRALPAVEVMRTLECIGNPLGGSLIGNAMWKGTLLEPLLKQAGIKSTAKYLTLDGADDYYTAVPIDVALNEQALIAYEMNGQPLNAEHGRPLRILLPGLYGQKQPKWLTHITVTDFYQKGPWEEQGWSDDAVIRPNSRIDRPLDNNVIVGKVGDIFTVAGIAFASSWGIARVQVSVDEGATWNEATLTQAPAPFTNLAWTRWGYQWKLPTSGKYIILARATDQAGTSQMQLKPGLFSGAFPDGVNTVPIAIVRVETNP